IFAVCDVEALTKLAQAEITAGLAALGVDVEVSVTVANPAGEDAVATLYRDSEVVDNFSRRDLALLSVVENPPDLLAMSAEQRTSVLAATARQLAVQSAARLPADGSPGPHPLSAETIRLLLDLWIRVPDPSTAAALIEQLGEDGFPEILVGRLRPEE